MLRVYFRVKGALSERSKSRLGGIAAFKKETCMALHEIRLYSNYLRCYG